MYRKINFTTPFASNCYGVVLSQDYEETDDAVYLPIVTVKSFDRNGFIVNAGRNEFFKPIYYIAFGK